jgi:hypothetical protein
MILLRIEYLQMYKETATHAKDIREQMEEPEDYLQNNLTPMCHMVLDWTTHQSCNGKKRKSWRTEEIKV